MEHRPTRAQRALLLLPFLGGLGWMITQLLAPDASGELSVYGLAVGPLVVPLAALSSVLLVLRARHADDDEERRRSLDLALLLPCALAPTVVAAPWVVAPSHLGIGLGSLPFFVSWLTRYPTVGGVNHEVLLGIGAVLGASAVPVALAAHAWLGRAPRLPVVATLAVLQLVTYLPVLLELDLELMAFAALGGLDEGLGLQGLGALAIGAGPIVRLWATLAMIAYVPITASRSAPSAAPVWES